MAVVFNSLPMRFPRDISWSVDLWPRKIFLPSVENAECHHSTDYKASKNTHDCCAGTGLHFRVIYSSRQLTSLFMHLYTYTCTGARAFFQLLDLIGHKFPQPCQFLLYFETWDINKNRLYCYVNKWPWIRSSKSSSCNLPSILELPETAMEIIVPLCKS